jgi:hypothetical protein
MAVGAGRDHLVSWEGLGGFSIIRLGKGCSRTLCIGCLRLGWRYRGVTSIHVGLLRLIGRTACACRFRMDPASCLAPQFRVGRREGSVTASAEEERGGVTEAARRKQPTCRSVAQPVGSFGTCMIKGDGRAPLMGIVDDELEPVPGCPKRAQGVSGEGGGDGERGVVLPAGQGDATCDAGCLLQLRRGMPLPRYSSLRGLSVRWRSRPACKSGVCGRTSVIRGGWIGRSLVSGASGTRPGWCR